MNYSVGVEYALHTLIYLVNLDQGTSIGIKALASIHETSATYLSKVYAKLKKQNIVRSTPGVKGGYCLARTAEHITFLDVLQAIEGDSMLFQCNEIRCKNSISDPIVFTSPCLIKHIMDDAQALMLEKLKTITLQQLYEDAWNSFDDDKQLAITAWLEDNVR